MYMSIPLLCALMFPSTTRMYILDRGRCAEILISCQLNKDCDVPVEINEKYPNMFRKPTPDSVLKNWKKVK